MGGSSQNTQSASNSAGNTATASLTDFLTQALQSYVQNTAQNTASNTAQNTASATNQNSISNYGQQTAQNSAANTVGSTAQSTAANTLQNSLANFGQQSAQSGTSNTDATTALNSAQNTASNASTSTNQSSLASFGQNTTGSTTSTSTYDPSAAAKALIEAGASPVSAEAIANYSSPYQKQVVDATLAQLAEDNAQQAQALKGNAISQNALGGDRSKVAQAVLAGQQGRTTASTLASLNQANYNQALSAAQTDAARQLQAAGLSGGTTTAGQQSVSGTTGQSSAATTGATNTAQTGTTNLSSLGQTNSGTTEQTNTGTTGQSSAATMGQSNTGTVGLSNTGTTAQSNTGVTGQNTASTTGLSNTSTLGQSNLSSLGQANTATQGTTAGTNASQTAGSTGTNTASATSQAGKGAQATTTNPGVGSFIGMGLTGLSMLSDGGRVRRFADGGGVDPTQGQHILWPNAVPDMGAFGEKQAKEWRTLYDLGKKARGGLDRLLDAYAGDGDSSTQGGGPGQTGLIGKLGDLRSFGLASGGSAKADDFASLSVVMPTLPMAMASMPYLPAAIAAAPSVAVPRITMPETQRPQVAVPHVDMPTVPTATAPEAHVSSSGKGSGGAVRGFADGGDIGDMATPIDLSKIGSSAGDNNGFDSFLLVPGHAERFAGAYVPYQRDMMSQERLENPWAALGGWKTSNSTIPTTFSERMQQQMTGDGGVSWTKPNPAVDADTMGAGLASGDVPGGAPAPVTGLGALQYAGQPVAAQQNGAPLTLLQFDQVGESKQAETQPVAPVSGLGALAAPVTSTDSAEQSGLASLEDRPIPVRTETYPVSQTDLVKAGFAPQKPVSGRAGVVQSVVDELRGGGASDSAIRGILANVRDESNFNPNLRHPDQPRWTGEAHYAHGLFQEGGAEWNKYASWLKENHPDENWQDPALQTRFLAENLRQNYPAVWKRMNEGTPEEAAQAFVSGYLRPRADYRQERVGRYSQGVPDIGHYIDSAGKMAAEGIETVGKGVGQGVSGIGEGLGTIASGAQRLISRGFSDTGQQHPYEDQQDRDSGGLLKRFLGVDFNPLKLTSDERKTLFVTGAAMMATGNVGKGLLAGSEHQMEQAKLDRQAKLDAMKLQMEFAKLQQPVLMGEETDALGRTKKVYGTYNVNTRGYDRVGTMGAHLDAAATPGVSTAPLVGTGAAPSGDIPADVHGDDFLKQAGLNASDATLIKSMADYKMPIEQFRRMQNNPQMMSMVERYDPRFDAKEYKARQNLQTLFKSGRDAEEIKSYNTLTGHVANLYDHVDDLHNTISSWVNTPLNMIREQTSTAFQRAKARVDTDLDTAIAEYNRATTGKPITVEESKLWHSRLNSSGSPEAMKEVAREFMHNVQSRMDSTAQKWNAGMGLSPGDPGYKSGTDLLYPDSRGRVNHILGGASAGQGAESRTQAAATPQASAAPVRPQGLSDDAIRQQAAAAIQAGKDPAAVRARLQQWGVAAQ